MWIYAVYANESTPYTPGMTRLDREAVVRAALTLVDSDGLDQVSLRRVADRLDVTAMALYRYVAGKADLLDGVADLLYAELATPEPGRGWWTQLAGLARSMRRVLLAHPAAAPLFSRPLAGPHSVKLGASFLSALRQAGFDRREAEELHQQLGQMVYALVVPELRVSGKHRLPDPEAAFERGIELLHAGLRARLAGKPPPPVTDWP